MGKKHPGVDAYIAKSADFAKPILLRLRKVVHTACPAVEEELKWNFPHFMYHGMLCSMAAFKAHCSFGFCAVRWSRKNTLSLVDSVQKACDYSVHYRRFRIARRQAFRAICQDCDEAERRRHQAEKACEAEA